jgi:hypothetical protein
MRGHQPERMPPARDAIPVTLDADTRNRLRALCDARAIPITTLMEAFARAATAEPEPEWLEALAADALRIMVERRRRPRSAPQFSPISGPLFRLT